MEQLIQAQSFRFTNLVISEIVFLTAVGLLGRKFSKSFSEKTSNDLVNVLNQMKPQHRDTQQRAQNEPAIWFWLKPIIG